MSIEIERKFLIINDDWKNNLIESNHIIQGYISSGNNMTTRIRISDDKGYITVKGKRSHWSRSEFEYEIPVDDAKDIILESQCPTVQKIRHIVNQNGLIWEVDEFKGNNRGLIYVELELTSETQIVTLPNWVGDEISEDAKYRNSKLATSPFKTWNKKSKPKIKEQE